MADFYKATGAIHLAYFCYNALKMGLFGFILLIVVLLTLTYLTRPRKPGSQFYAFDANALRNSLQSGSHAEVTR